MLPSRACILQSLREDVEWLGWKPIMTTYSSDNFQQLHDYAVQLIKDGKAYVCHQVSHNSMYHLQMNTTNH
jgi:glutamyl/glutaminyl-tRNA synthetase